jgi:hypothetical protein
MGDGVLSLAACRRLPIASEHHPIECTRDRDVANTTVVRVPVYDGKTRGRTDGQ